MVLHKVCARGDRTLDRTV